MVCTGLGSNKYLWQIFAVLFFFFSPATFHDLEEAAPVLQVREMNQGTGYRGNLVISKSQRRKSKSQKDNSYEKGSERFTTFLFPFEKKSMAIGCLKNKDSLRER